MVLPRINVVDVNIVNSIASSPAIRLALPANLSSRALTLAQRLFSSSDASIHLNQTTSSSSSSPSSPRGFYQFRGLPSQVTRTPAHIAAFQLGPKDTRALRKAYFEPDKVPHNCVHENVVLSDAMLQRDAEQVFAELDEVCAQVLRRMALVDNRIEPFIRSPFDSYVEFKRYSIDDDHGSGHDDHVVAMNEHRDQTLLTLLIQSPSPTPFELQVRTVDSANNKSHWLGTVASDSQSNDCAIVHVGDLLERATYGRFQSTMHRVVATSSTTTSTASSSSSSLLPRERFSVALFCMPSWHVRVDDITLVGDLLPVY